MEVHNESANLTKMGVNGEKDSKNYHLESIVRLAEHLFSNLGTNEAVEMRTLGTKTQHGLFRSKSSFIETTKRISGEQPVYFSLNARNLSALKKNEMLNHLYIGSSYGTSSVTNVTHAFFDFDRILKHKPASQNELDACLAVAESVSAMLTERDVRHWLCMSGNGYHIFIQLQKVDAIKGSDLLRQLLSGLQAAYGDEVVEVDTGVFDSPRICKLYGTQSIKKGSDSDHPNRVSHIIKHEQLREEPIFEKLSDFIHLKSKMSESGSEKNTDVVGIFKKHSLYIRPLKAGKHIVLCPNSIIHGQNSDGASTTAIFDGTSGFFGFKCFHNSCGELHLKDVLKMLNERIETDFADGFGRPEKFQLLSLQDLLNTPAPKYQWLVDNHLTIGGTSIFVSRPKTGKSTLLRDLACCVAAGESWLGFHTLKGAVIYLAFEEKIEMLQLFFKERGMAKNLDLFLHTGIAPRKSIMMLSDLIKKHNAKLLIVDTMLRLEGVKEPNDYSETNERMEKLNHIARQTGCHIALVHHQGKGSDKKSGEESVLGSTAISGGVDAIFSIEKQSSGLRFLTSTQRYGKDLVRSGLVLDHSTQKFELQGVKEQRHESLTEKIMSSLEIASPQTIENLKSNLNARKEYILEALNTLVSQGDVIKSGKGLRGSPRQYLLSPNRSSLDIFN